MSFYNKQYDRVVEQYKAGKLSQKNALDRILEIEKRAYEILPNAEPDGDITYGASLAAHEIGVQ